MDTDDRDAYRVYLLKKHRARQADIVMCRDNLANINAAMESLRLEREIEDARRERSEASYGEF